MSTTELAEGRCGPSASVSASLPSANGLTGRRDLDGDDPRWQTRVPDPLVNTDWFQSLPPPARARYCLTRICDGLASGIGMETVLSIALRRYADTQPGDSAARRWLATELQEEARHSELFRSFLARAHESCPELPTTGVDDGLLGLARKGWLQAAVSRPELLFMMALCGEEPVTALQAWYLGADRSRQHPALRSLYQRHLADELDHVRRARETLVRHLDGLHGAGHHRLAYLAPLAATRTAGHLIWPSKRVLQAFAVPDSVLSDPAAKHAGQELVGVALAPLVRSFLALGVITERTAPLWGSVRGATGFGTSRRAGAAVDPEQRRDR